MFCLCGSVFRYNLLLLLRKPEQSLRRIVAGFSLRRSHSIPGFSFISFPSVPLDGAVRQSRPHRTPTIKQIIRRSLECVCCGSRKLDSHDVGSERACLLVNMLPVCKAGEEIEITALSGVTGRKLMCEIKLPAWFHREPRAIRNANNRKHGRNALTLRRP